MQKTITFRVPAVQFCPGADGGHPYFREHEIACRKSPLDGDGYGPRTGKRATDYVRNGES